MPRPIVTSPRSPEPDIGSRALTEPLRTGPKSDDPEIGGPGGFISPRVSTQNGNGSKFAEPEADKGADESTPSYMTAFIAPVFVQMFGFAIAVLYVYFAKADAEYTSKASALVKAGLHWVYASAALLAFTVRLVNFYPFAFKQLVMTGALKEKIGINVRANPFIYKCVDDTGSAVIFDNEGAVGRYNRANRSLHHMIENMAPTLVCMLLAGYVFPMPSFVCVAVFCAGRLMHQVGYAGGYGGHGAGFALSLLAASTLEGFTLLVALAGTPVLGLFAEFAL
jgi:hypothetical protein